MSDPGCGLMYKLEVKTTGYRSATGSACRRSSLLGYNFEWMMSKKHEDVIDPSLVFAS